MLEIKTPPEDLMAESLTNDNPFSKESFLGLKGYLAILIIIHHLYQFTCFFVGTSFGTVLYHLGHYAVVVFLFLSGFGLFSSYLAKGETYIRTFLRNRIIPFYVTYLIFVVIYAVYALINGSSVTASQIIRSLTYGYTIVGFGWYFQTALLMYLFFYILKLIFKNENAFVVALGVAIAAFIILYYFFVSSTKTYYEPAFSFYLGVLASYIYSQKKTVFTKSAWLKALVWLVLFIGLAAFSIFYNYRFNDYKWEPLASDFVYMLLQMASDLALNAFVLFFTAAVMPVAPGFIVNPISRFIGARSLEIYAIQGILFGVLYKIIGNRAVFAAVAVTCLIPIGVLLHMLTTAVKNLITGK